MSSQIDLGLRLFLVDDATGGFTSFTGVLGAFGLMLASVAEQSTALVEKINELAASMAAAQDAFALGLLTQQEFDDIMVANSTQLAQYAEQLDTLNVAMGGLAVAAGGALDLSLFAGALKYSGEQAIGLQDAMVKLQLAVQGTNENLDGMRTFLINVANSSVYSTTELADGFQLLGERGYTAAQIIGDGGQNSMGVALTHLAEAIGATGSGGVVGASGLLASAMELWGAKASEGAHYADLLTYAFYNGIPSVDSLRQGLEAVGGTANVLKIPFDQIVVALDQLARAGMSGSQAGASLNYMLNALSSPIQKTQNEMSYLGLLTVNSVTPAFKNFTAELDRAAAAAGTTSQKFDGSVTSLDNMFKQAQQLKVVNPDANFYQWAISLGILNSKFYDSKGNFLGFENALEQLNNKLKGMNPEEKAAALQALFNVKSGQGAKDLLNVVDQTIKKIDALKHSGDAQGTAMKDAALITSTFSTKLKELLTTLADVGARIGLPIVTALADFFGKLNEGISMLTAKNPQLYGFLTSFLLVGAGLSAVAVIVGVAIAAFMLLSTPILLVLGTALIVAGGIMIMSAAFGLLIGYLHSAAFAASPLGKALSTLFSQIGAVLGPVMKDVGRDMGDITKIMGGVVSSFNSGLKPAFTSLAQTINQNRPAILALVGLIGGVLLAAIRGLVVGLAGAAPFIGLVFAGLVRVIIGAVQIIIGVFAIIGAIVETFVLLFTGHADKIKGVWLAAFAALGHGVINILQGLGQMLLGVIGAIGGFLAGFVIGLVNGIIGLFTHLADTLVGHSIIPDMLRNILNWFRNIGAQVLGFLFGWVPGVLSHFTGLASSVVSLMQGLPGRIVGALSSLGSMLYNAGVNAMNMLGSGIQNAIGSVLGPVQNVASSIMGFLGFHSPPKDGPLKDSDQYMPNMMRMYAHGIQQHTPLLSSAVRGAASALNFSSPAAQAAHSATTSYGSSAQAAGNTTVPINIDGHCVATVVLNRLTGTLQMNGAGRVLR